ncbi:MAG: aminopeptidase P family protein [Pseudolabrys sp.]|nr:aminopeptidase P family protein [Pseudolabrys sp.]
MLTPAPRSDLAASIPFDCARLDRLMEEENIDLLLATSKHNVQYLLGGHRADFFDYMDATGTTRYLPIVIYPKGTPEKAGYVGHRLEKWQQEANPMWTPLTQTASNGSVDAMQKAVDTIKKAGLRPRRIGAEFGFLPYDAAQVLRAAFSDAELVDATLVLDRQRAKKTPEELKNLKHASETVLASMEAVIANHGPGSTKREIAEALRREEVNRGLTFEYCLITAGASHNRAPSEQRWEKGDVLSLDSGGNYHGYIGDICRMAIMGEPDAELVDLLGEIENIQRAGFDAIRPGVTGNQIYAACEPLVQKSRHHNHMDFLAHGMGLVSHEAPRLADRTVAVPYLPEHRDKPLEAGMVVSVETTLLHSTRGFIKLEDTIVVTDKGREIYAEGARGWNRGGTAAR